MYSSSIIKIRGIVLVVLLISISIFAQVRTANPSNIDQIISWGNDGSTTKIIFPEGVYEFPKTMSLGNDDLVLQGSGMNKTIIRLTAVKNSLIDAVGNNYRITNLTLDGGKNQKAFANPIFRFNKSKGHQFENVEFTNSTYNGIGAINGYATDGLVLKNCVFSNIDSMPLQIFNRNTNLRGGQPIVSVDKVTIDGCTFREGYETGISCDNGNDRQDTGNGIGRRYTENTSINGTTIQNCVFEKSKQFHIALVQTKDVIIQNNSFAGMTDDAGGGCQSIHMEQFTENIEIYNNTFSMAPTVSQTYNYILISGTEGHKRVTQERPSETYASWTYNVNGDSDRRADTQCATSGNVNKDCKRDVHAYGPRNVFIAGNTFNESPKVNTYLVVGEGENIQIGTTRANALSLNDFIGGDDNSKKIAFGGNDEGTGNVLIRFGQNVKESNIDVKNVNFDLPPIRLKKPIVVEGELSTTNGFKNESFQLYPNPATDQVFIRNSGGTVTISNVSGQVLQIIMLNDEEINKIALTGFATGVYFLTLETVEGNRSVQKLFVN